MVEYGGGINNGPAGQVGGGSGSQQLGDVDVFTSIGNVINDTTNMIAAWPPEMLVAAIVIVFVGLVILKRAF